MKKKIKTISLFILSFMLVFLSGCVFFGPDDIGDGGSTTPPELNEDEKEMINHMQGVKACYRPNEYDFQNLYYDYAKNILTGIVKVYGTNEIDNYSWAKGEGQLFNQTGNSVVLANNAILFNLIPCLDDEHSTETTNLYLKMEDNSSFNWTFNFRNIVINEQLNQDKLFGDYNIIDNQKKCFTFDDYKSKTNQTKNEIVKAYNDYYIKPFTPALECVIYEILLKEEPSVFEINNSGTTPLIKKDGKDINVYLQEKKNQYKKLAEYVGLTKEDNDKIIKYVFNNVIGDERINKDNFNYSNDSVDTEQKTKLNYVYSKYNIEENETTTNQILWLNRHFKATDHSIEDLGNVRNYIFKIVKKTGILDGKSFNLFNTFPTAYIQDYKETDMFVINDEDSLKNIPAKEYKSIAIMPSNKDSIKLIGFAFESKNDLKIRINTRYYNSSTKKIEKIYHGTINIKANEIFSMENIQILDCADDNGKVVDCKLDNFNNEIGKGILKTTKNNPKRITSVIENEDKLSNYYKNIQSEDSFSKITVLNEANINHNFYEILFDIEKNENELLTKNYDFKVGLVSIAFGK